MHACMHACIRGQRFTWNPLRMLNEKSFGERVVSPTRKTLPGGLRRCGRSKSAGASLRQGGITCKTIESHNISALSV